MLRGCFAGSPAVPRAFAPPSPSLAPVAGTAAFNRSVILLSGFRGLEIHSARSSRWCNRETMLISIILAKLNFLDVIFAPWCGSCLILYPVTKDSIPTVSIFKNGMKKIDTVIGAVSWSTLSTCIERFL
ncbi:thioredoxin M-type, chloroplastic-like [Henckelia pumila]|uniref:thioredoxin M-type, chloroplastic-like n=1 Tax=Henckelia pumila TaxID=405737 RepID=UPI003C6E4378